MFSSQSNRAYKNFQTLMKTALCGTILAFSSFAFSQSEEPADPTADAADNSATDQIEDLFNSEAKKEVSKASDVTTPSTTQATEDKSTPKKEIGEIKTLGQLKKLEPFDDIAVIQKKYLTKTKRFEVSGGGSLTLNDPFFSNYAYWAKGGYYFTEAWGIEFSYLSFITSQKSVTTDLLAKGIETTSLVISKSYVGADIKWSPIYGKFSYLNKSIVPFDMFFTGGVGSTATNQGTSPMTMHIGTGQLFALTHNVALRWDLNWNIFQSTSTISNQKEVVDNVFFQIGLSYFFPEARVR